MASQKISARRLPEKPPSPLPGFLAPRPKEEIRFGLGKSSLGRVLVASSARGVVSIQIGDRPEHLADELKRRFPRAILIRDDIAAAPLVARVAACIADPAAGLDFPLDIRGTPFQQKVWAAAAAIPLGATSTYTEIARLAGSPRAIRAVGSACASNKLALAIPCHRVLHKDGTFSGGSYWTPPRQRILMRREAAAAAQLKKRPASR